MNQSPDNNSITSSNNSIASVNSQNSSNISTTVVTPLYLRRRSSRFLRRSPRNFKSLPIPITPKRFTFE